MKVVKILLPAPKLYVFIKLEITGAINQMVSLIYRCASIVASVSKSNNLQRFADIPIVHIAIIKPSGLSIIEIDNS